MRIGIIDMYATMCHLSMCLFLLKLENSHLEAYPRIAIIFLKSRCLENYFTVVWMILWW